MKIALTSLWIAALCLLFATYNRLTTSRETRDVASGEDSSLSADLVGRQVINAPPEPARGAAISSSRASQGAAVEDPAVVSGSLGSLNILQASDEYHPTRERFLALAGAIYLALDATPDELAEAGEGPWQKFDLNTLRRELRPESELAALWTLPDTQALWALHQEQFLTQANLLILLGRVEHGATRNALERELEITRARLDELRLAIWNDPAYRALYLLSKELR